MALDFGTHPDVVFDHAPLVTVLCQVKFPSILSLMARAGVAGFQEALRSEYPQFVVPARGANVQVTGDRLVEFEPVPPTWKLTDERGAWIVGLSTDFVSLETPSYTDIGEFLGRFDQILAAVRRTLRPADSLRVGLRKVNFFAAPDGDNPHSLVGQIRSELLGPLAVADYPAEVAAYMATMNFQDEDNALVARYGLGQRDESAGFVLDLDYSTEHRYLVEPSADISTLLQTYSSGMTSFFHWALEDSLKEQLGPRPRYNRGASA